jgi:hypothetical protein
MRDLIELLRSQPILVVLLAAWVFGAISNAVQKQRRQQQQQKPQQPKPRRPADGDTSARRPTADEVAAEMRRGLGLDPPPRPAAKPPKPPAAVKPASPPRRVIAPPSQPLPRALSKVEALAPTVGERIEARPTPASGAVGAQAPGTRSLGNQALGNLGGRAGGRMGRRPRGGSTLVDLRDLPRAFVMREVLDLPLALREPRV